MQWTTDETLQALCRTFLHSLWQGLIAAVLAALVLLLTRRATARVRYNLLGGLLLLFMVTTGISFYNEINTSHESVTVIITSITPSPSAATQHPGEILLAYMNQHAGFIMLVWLLIFLFKFTKLMTGFLHIHRIRGGAVPVNNDWQQQVRRLMQKLGMQKAILLLESDMVQMPLTLGFLKPCIYVPVSLLTQLPADQVETILLHELAHIRRKDYFMNILQSFADTVFFFNPALLWISARLREERENCCDDIVLEHTSHKATYMNALLAFQEHNSTELGMAIQGKHNHLYNRVKRMLTRENQKLNIMEKTVLIASLVAITAFSLLPGLAAPVQAQQQKQATQNDRWRSEPASKKDKWVTQLSPYQRENCEPVSKDLAAADAKDTWQQTPGDQTAKDKWATVLADETAADTKDAWQQNDSTITPGQQKKVRPVKPDVKVNARPKVSLNARPKVKVETIPKVNTNVNVNTDVNVDTQTDVRVSRLDNKLSPIGPDVVLALAAMNGKHKNKEISKRINTDLSVERLNKAVLMEEKDINHEIMENNLSMMDIKLKEEDSVKVYKLPGKPETILRVKPLKPAPEKKAADAPKKPATNNVSPKTSLQNTLPDAMLKTLKLSKEDKKDNC